MSEPEIDLLANRLNYDAVVFKSCTMNELLLLAGLCLGVCCMIFAILLQVLFDNFLYGIAGCDLSIMYSKNGGHINKKAVTDLKTYHLILDDNNYFVGFKNKNGEYEIKQILPDMCEQIKRCTDLANLPKTLGPGHEVIKIIHQLVTSYEGHTLSNPLFWFYLLTICNSQP